MTKIISYEGPDSIGKKTQTTLLYNFLIMRGYKVALYEIPYRNHLYSMIYHMLFNGTAVKFPLTFLIVQTLNKLIFEYTVLKPNMHKYDVVILDRWRLSTYVYGYCSGVNKWIAKLCMYLSCKPTITFVLEGKSFDRKNKDDYEKNITLQENVRKTYKEFSNDNPDNHFVIDANQEQKEILENINMILQNKKIL